MTHAFFTAIKRTFTAPDVAIDLGTANTRLYAQGLGMLADEPSVVRVRKDTGLVEAVGLSATMQHEPKARLVSPLHAGVITDVNAATELLMPLMRRARRFGLRRPRVLACAPTDACEQERSALIEATRRAGASAVVVVPEPLAAAIGMGLDVSSDYAQMLVDIGDGVTDIAVIRAGELITTAAVRTACSDLINLASQCVANEYGLSLYHSEARRLVQKIGTGQHLQSTYVVAGVDCQTGTMKRIFVAGATLAPVLQPALQTITQLVTHTLCHLPDEVACQVIENGIRLTGGGACLDGMADWLTQKTSVQFRVAQHPMHSVINGARQMLRVGALTQLWSR